MKEKLEAIKAEALAKIDNAKTLDDLNEIKVAVLGKKGELTAVLKGMKDVPAEERPMVGQMVNETRAAIEEKLEEEMTKIARLLRTEKMKRETIDVTLPGKKNMRGHRHPNQIALEDLERVFVGMGYEVVEGPEVEYDRYNFELLNIPANHPAKDEQDTFYINKEILLRTQTSPVQARIMEKGNLPIRILSAGRVFRADEVDATHSPSFHQVEGLVIDKNITFADLKGTLEQFAQEFFGEKTKVKFRPHHFPFTEPSAEVDISCFKCGGKGCRMCKGSGWIEILGCGMVHPNVLEMCGIDSKEYQGFAFGIGLERVTLLKYEIDDMRLLYENDVRFFEPVLGKREAAGFEFGIANIINNKKEVIKMNTPISWIKAYVPDLDVDVQEFIDKMTLSGSHVEGYEKKDKNLEKIVVGKIETMEQHPDADKLVVCQVNVGTETLQIVTGAKNVKVGDMIPLVLDGGKVAAAHGDETEYPDGIKIKKGKLRGIESNGMMCGIEELGSSRDFYPEAPEDGVYVFMEDSGVKPGDDAVKALGLDDTVVEYEITSNRVDCFSMIGMAREVAATFNKPFYPPVVTVKANDKDVNDFIKVTVEDNDLCTRYCARVVENIKIGPSPKWMQDRLKAMGIRSINNLVDITNYIMEEYGQPMHAYDLSTIAKNEIIVKRAADGEVFTTLDGQERKLDSEVLMICDGEKQVGIAGIMGGENSMITEEVQTVLFEAACFDGTNIRLSSKRIGLQTDASFKFTKGLDPNTAIEAINRACQLVEEMGCGDVVGGVVDVYPNHVSEKILPFEPERYNALLGTDISKEDMLTYFEKLDLKYNEADNTLTIPTFRQDLGCMADLAEEVARFYGYDNIPVSLPKGEATVGKKPFNQRVEDIGREICERNGFSGGMTYSFESPKVFDKLLLPEDAVERQAIVISNPLGEDFSIMRTVSLNGMLTSLATNYNRRNKSARLYELGNIYCPKALPLTELPDEKMRLTLGMYGEGDFFTMKGVVEEIFEKLGVVGIECEPTGEIPYLHPGRQAYLKKGKLDIGMIGQVHPEVADNYNMKAEAYVAVLNMDVLTMLATFDRKYEGIAKFPASNRDLSMVMDKSLFVGQIEHVIKKNAGKILESCELFDVYEGEQVGEGKKSVAFSLIFRAKDRNLESSEVDKAVEKVLDALKQMGIELRA